MSTIKVEKYLYAQKGAKEGLKKVMLETLVMVHAQTVALCPVQYGQLKNSYMVVFDGKEIGFNSSSGESAPADQKLTVKSAELLGYVGTNSDHWYPEFGTRNQIAQPHIRPAVMIAKGSGTQAAMGKYCRSKMEEEFRQRKYEYIFREVT
jgi:hypothetical protein